jgi:type II secretory pathway pseudopilin PulG
MSIVTIVIVVLLVLIVVFFIGGLIIARRRAEATADRLQDRIAAADRALEAARAADRGWDPILLEEAARGALQRERPDFRYDRLHLVLVDDRPGTEDDRAEMAAVGDEGVVHVSVARRGDSWVAERVS